jgi:hypothetical protein
MKAKTITTIFLTSMLTVMWSSAVWAADRFNTRDNRQTRRIHQGINSGKIIRPEFRYLRKEQRRIDRAYDRALADGRFNRHERMRLNKMQDRAGRHISRAKHNYGRRHLRRHYYHPGHRGYHHRVKTQRFLMAEKHLVLSLPMPIKMMEQLRLHVLLP